MMCVGWLSERWWSLGGEWLHHSCSWVEGGECMWEEVVSPLVHLLCMEGWERAREDTYVRNVWRTWVHETATYNTSSTLQLYAMWHFSTAMIRLTLQAPVWKCSSMIANNWCIVVPTMPYSNSWVCVPAVIDWTHINFSHSTQWSTLISVESTNLLAGVSVERSHDLGLIQWLLPLQYHSFLDPLQREE